MIKVAPNYSFEALPAVPNIVSDPNKAHEEYRNYTDSKRHARVEQHYRLNHKYQTYDSVQTMKAQIYPLTAGKFTVWEMFELADRIMDDSDPDLGLSQIHHALQAAEAARQFFPEEKYDWLHLTGFLHDLGKVLELDLNGARPGGLPQWAVTGDTFPVGCAFEDTVVFSEFFKDNPDTQHPIYSTKFGIYEPNCGLDNVHFSFGHDDYLAVVLERAGTTLPPMALKIIRYHSFYAWHTGGGYRHLCNDDDMQALEWVQRFQKCDLYSKVEKEMDTGKLLPYYRDLVEKYIGNDTRLAL
eukprot:TRINITY_DN1330_c0_g1::TRINITY_DN1330_c0_g1_i1::g.20022::m.20022 TRINITY_DN1330_c0_g1::TRINITY_DN1330_c0_g1_i1::g.20022  ORF type:complete len:336 (-),score=51.95,sp/Q5Z8T3/MIOX_ORYSJ/50.55/5e-86,DUF706/PF05153.10/1.9e-98,HD/PF01966.17/0.066,HD/PF01966.17/5.4e+02 TRINITY_DN1330_c0_g1_i1:150-1043(-)